MSSQSAILAALSALGKDANTRAALIAELQRFERLPHNRFTAVRDEVTGPIIDALHAGVEVVRKELSNGLVFEFLYRSKIARDFVMSVPAKPDHVWEPQTTKLLLHLSKAARHVMVGGAHFGDHAILVANQLRGHGICHAFDIDRDELRMLERNAALNQLNNVRIQHIGLWSDTTSRLGTIGHDALSSTFQAEEGIPTTTIDAYAVAAGIDHLELILLDLEGAELPALRGAQRVLSEHAPHVIFEVHRSYVDWSAGLENTEIVRYLTSFGYLVYAVRDFQSNVDLRDRMIELEPLDTVYLEGPPHGFNLLAVRDTAVLDPAIIRMTANVSPKYLFHRDPKLHHPHGGL